MRQHTYGGGAGTRLYAAKKVIKKIVSNTDLTSGANFGLMEWGTRHNIRVKISDTWSQTNLFKCRWCLCKWWN